MNTAATRGAQEDLKCKENESSKDSCSLIVKVDKNVNTEDTLRYVPFEVDHWATKCVRFADEFQTSRSFDDAQSNISELTESLEQYLNLREGDGTLRTDILLYCVLSNIVEGLQANEQIFTNQVPSICQIIWHSLLTSGQLGRYGFQSFKQSIKTIRFLKEYYHKRDDIITPPRLPVILWQSVKKISMQGTTLYPTLFPGEFRFHMDSCPDSESCKSKTVRLDFGETETTSIYLRYCTSSSELLEAFKKLPSQDLDFGCDHVEPKLDFFPQPSVQESSSLSKLMDISLQQFIICDIDLGLSSIKELIANIIQSQPQYSKSLEQLHIDHGGSVVLRFKSRYLNPKREVEKQRTKIYVLGTKQYWEKHLQILIIDRIEDEYVEPSSNSSWLIADLQGRKVQEAELIQDLHTFKWDLQFGSCPAGCWTHPEVHFVNQLTILPLLEECIISFEDHSCPSDKPKCSDCSLIQKQGFISVDQVFGTGSVEINVKLDLHALNVFTDDHHSTTISPGKFALFKFALSIPLQLRGLVIELQKESKLRRRRGEEDTGLFSDADFESMTKLWDKHKEYYYALWYAS